MKNVIHSCISTSKKKINISRLSIFPTILIFFLCSSMAYSQSGVATQLKSYKMCRIDKTDASEYDCRQVIGELLYRKIIVVPNKSITTYPKGEIGENEAIKVTWDFSNLHMNNDKDLFIYKSVETDINKPGGASITVVMRLDYTVQAVVYILNYEGNITKFTMFDK